MTADRIRTFTLAGAALAACLVLLAGCSNSSGPSGSGDPGATSAEEVLEDFARAYNRRDVAGFLACLSEDFKFHFSEQDQHEFPQLPPWFYRSDERQVHENMFGDDWNVESISLTLTPTCVETIPEGGPGARSGDVVVMRVSTDLRVLKTGNVTWMASDPQELRFREVAGSRDGDDAPLWEMFEWHDLEDGRAGGGREDAGWGGIKYTFLESLSEPSRRTSPTDVLEQLRTAYVGMDVVNYLDCLSEDFVFYPSDIDVQNPGHDIPPMWYKPDERNMHENMFAEGGNVTNISLTMTEYSSEFIEGDPADPTDDIYVFVEDPDLRVFILGGLEYHANAPTLFRLHVDIDDEGPYGQLMWEIYEWHDDPILGDASDRVEESTWGSIKALYR